MKLVKDKVNDFYRWVKGTELVELDDIDVKRRVWRDRVTNVVFSGPFTIEQLEKYSDEFLQLLYSEIRKIDCSLLLKLNY